MALMQLDFSSLKGHEKMVLDLDPTRSNEHHILRYINAGQLYEPDIAYLMLRVVKPDDVVVDVGANAGFFTVFLATLVGPQGRVISFEPEENNLGRLKNNIASNKLENVTVIEQPASEAPGEVTFFINSDDSGGNALWDIGKFPGNENTSANNRTIRLQATTVDDEIARLQLSPPKLIKIDTEGAEFQVLKGCRTLLEGRQIPYVIAEYHPFGIDKMGESPQAFRAFMESFGYSCFGLYYDGEAPRMIPLDAYIDAPCVINLLFSTPENVARAWPTFYHHPSASRPKS